MVHTSSSHTLSQSDIEYRQRAKRGATYEGKPATKEQLQLFVAACQDRVDAYNTANRFTPDEPVTLGSINESSRYVRITRGGSAHCFVELETGFILKAASFKAPAKGPRGTIWSEDNGRQYMGPYGAGYLKGM